MSKLWIKKKMKAKIDTYYGEEAASKFKGSDNWFQRFKKRHNISFRRRSNKKKDLAYDGRETIQRFHRNLREAVKSRGDGITQPCTPSMSGGSQKTATISTRCPCLLS